MVRCHVEGLPDLADEVVDVLVNALGDADNDVRLMAGQSLPKMSKVAVPVLIKSLQNGKAELKPMAIKILGDIGAEAAPAEMDAVS